MQQAIRDTTGCGDHKTVQFVENLLKTKEYVMCLYVAE